LALHTGSGLPRGALAVPATSGHTEIANSLLAIAAR